MVMLMTKHNKSLRQIAKELDVTHSYLSQVLHGKRPVSERIAFKLSQEGLLSVNGKQVVSKYGNEYLVEKTVKILYNEPKCGCNSAVECLLPKQDVVGSNPITRSIRRKGVSCLPKLPAYPDLPL